MENPASNNNFGSKSHVLDPQPSLQTIKSGFQNTKCLFNNAPCFAVCTVEPLARWIFWISKKWSDQPFTKRISTVTKKNCTREWKLFLNLKFLPKRAVLKDTTVMIPSSMVSCHVEDLSLWTSDTQDINRVTVVPVQKRNFIIMWRRN